tara:strand:- start:747 stop:998 length:252 start_codon:yes stop_codon:yes gene_type:complete
MASTDEYETLKRFAETNRAKFPILSDPDGNTATEYDVLKFGKFASRTTFIIDGEGVILKIIKNVNPVSAGKDLLQILAKLPGA